jgi:predicted nucleotidyltransferase
MSTIVTLSHRKAHEAARCRAAAEEIAAELQAFARRCGGRILLFGSAARGGMTEMSDIDLLIDVPAGSEADAWSLAEHLSRLHDIPVDIHSARTTKPEFVRRIEAGARVLA